MVNIFFLLIKQARRPVSCEEVVSSGKEKKKPVNFLATFSVPCINFFSSSLPDNDPIKGKILWERGERD